MSKLSPGKGEEPTVIKPAVEIRPNEDGSIDEIVAKNCTLHIEQMSDDGWLMGIDGSDGSYWQFWIGSKNRNSAVEIQHTEMVPPVTSGYRTDHEP